MTEQKYKYGQQEQVTVRNHLGTVSIKILAGLNRFYEIPTSPSAEGNVTIIE